MPTSAATGQRVRPQLGVRNRAMSSAPACRDHCFLVGEEPMHAVGHVLVDASVDAPSRKENMTCAGASVTSKGR